MEPKVIVITGASDGIGAVGARRLHEMGATRSWS
jgi:NAD(P)-dependent dehydrogenase (short-subunit alcohol dehydrogenase family)